MALVRGLNFRKQRVSVLYKVSYLAVSIAILMEDSTKR